MPPLRRIEDPGSDGAALPAALQRAAELLAESDAVAPPAFHLPPLTAQQARHLVATAEAACFTWPRYGWALAAWADQVGLTPADPWTQAWLAWHHARAANACFQPQLAGDALARAQAGFAALGDEGWQAACVWQACALPWTRPHYAQTVAELEEALRVMQAAGLHPWVPYCQLTLAHALLLVTRYDDAQAQLAAALERFQAGGDDLQLAQAELVQSSLYRRRGAYAPAVTCGRQAYDRFAARSALVGMARAQEHIATAQLAWQQLRPAARSYRAALQLYTQVRLPMFVAQCYNGLAQIYDSLGQFTPAERAYSQARPILEQMGWQGALADNLLDHGVLELYRGRPRHSLSYLERAHHLYDELGVREFVGVAATTLGAAYEQLGQYQHALHHLEQAEETFLALGKEERLAENHFYQARVWLRLGFSEQAQARLETAATIFQAAGRAMWQIEAGLLQVVAQLARREEESAQRQVADIQTLAEEHHYQRHLVLAMRLGGQIMAQLGQMEGAIAQLQQARQLSEALDMPAEQIRCWLALATCYQKQALPQAAAATWHMALERNAALDLPDIAWQAYAGLGALAESAGETAQALAAYSQALSARVQLRRHFTQPELVDRYLAARPGLIVNHSPGLVEEARAIRLALRHNHHQMLALQFIEESKAQIALRQFSVANLPRRLVSPAARQLDDLRAAIQGRPPRHLPLPAQPVRSETVNLARLPGRRAAYVQRLQRLERADPPAALALQAFDKDAFAAAASARLSDWIALNFYDTGEELITLVLSPSAQSPCVYSVVGVGTAPLETVVAARQPITSRLRFALRLATDSQRQRHLTPADRRLLGQALIPHDIWERLTPDTCLIIAPHGQLHGLAWPSLLGPDGNTPLIAQACLTVVPSWHSLQLLWARQAGGVRGGRQLAPTGLALAVTTFGDRYSPLPHVAQEAQQLSAQTQARLLLDAAATWATLQQLAASDGLRRFPFWHIATHGLYDDHAGRLSGFALVDSDIWLDQLWELAPLPPLVTFSACSGGQRLVLQGDEQVGLSLTCLAAGASSVVGSLWPVLDRSSAELMLAFYAHYQTSQSPSQALAQAQRDLWREGRDLAEWGGFLCLGCP